MYAHAFGAPVGATWPPGLVATLPRSLGMPMPLGLQSGLHSSKMPRKAWHSSRSRAIYLLQLPRFLVWCCVLGLCWPGKLFPGLRDIRNVLNVPNVPNVPNNVPNIPGHVRDI